MFYQNLITAEVRYKGLFDLDIFENITLYKVVINENTVNYRISDKVHDLRYSDNETKAIKQFYQRLEYNQRVLKDKGFKVLKIKDKTKKGVI